MKLEHIGRIKGNITISTSMKAANILDGAYKSIFKGKSMNFEELREYNFGDNVKDIDWRASARSTNLLVREYVAEKKHNVIFILDSKNEMNANANMEDLKRDVSIDSAGTLAYLAYKNGDYTGAIYINNDMPKFFPLSQNLYSVENFLTCYEEDLKNRDKKDKSVNSIDDSLRYMTEYLSKKAVVFIITDLVGLEELTDDTLKTLSLRNDVMIINISDVSLFDSNSYDLDKKKYFSKLFLKNRKLYDIEQREKIDTYNSLTEKFARYKITTVTISSREEVVSKVIELLEEHRNMKIK